ncbi:MAG: GWxTD domain-containing protein [Bacteroidota bacterium]
MLRLNSIFTVLLVAGVAGANGQAISGFNLSHQYDPDSEVSLRMQPVRQGKNFQVLYTLSANRKEYALSDYEIQWERRASVSSRNGETTGIRDSIWVSSGNVREGSVAVGAGEKTWFLVARVTNRVTRGIWNFVASIELNWPVTYFLTEDNRPVTATVVLTGKTYRIGNFPAAGKLFCFYYKNAFNPAAPPFVSGAPSDRFINADSIFTLSSAVFSPRTKGLYLIQADTTAATGMPMYAAAPPFPRYNTIGDLTGPLLYLTTADEQADLMNAGGDKSRFDKVVLGITRDTDRAKSFMRSYYQRVETVNRLFTNYKEGWRTDMGMVYLIFGVPTEVSRSATTEIWYYKGTAEKFLFNRTGSVFAPFNHFLQRNNDYTQSWYSMVDLWRKARF